MLCTVVWDTYADSQREQVWRALEEFLPEHSPDWSRKGVYAYWDPATRRCLYVGLATNLPERFAQHNGLVPHGGGNKRAKIDEWFESNAHLGLTVMVQAGAVAMLDQMDSMAVGLGASSDGIIAGAEGQLIELHRLEHGTKPPWNGVGGLVTGQRWARPSGKSMIRVLSAADESLFVARRSLRDLVASLTGLRFEAAIHTARMQALLESHAIDKPLPRGAAGQEQIMRWLLLKYGKIVDDLAASDDQIREWLQRLGHREQWQARVNELQANLVELAGKAQVPGDRAVMEMLSVIVAGGAPPEDQVTVRAIFETDYLEEEPRLA